MRLLPDLFHDFAGMLFPDFCLACQEPLSRGERMICTRCVASLPYTNLHQHADNALSVKFWGKVQIEHAMAYLTFTPKGRVQRLLHQLKYKGAKDLGVLLGRWYGAELVQAGFQEQLDLVVPVPLHKSKLRLRGYNQAALFAEGLADTLEVIHLPNALQRNVFTSTQTNKARLERWQNVKRVFEVPDPELVRDKRVLLVDDVITTGSTLEACAHALLDAGCKSVSVAGIAAAMK